MFPAFGDESTIDYETVILETFDGETRHEWTLEGKTYSYDFSWKLDASKFASEIDGEKYPKMSYVPSWPQALFGVNREGRNLQSLGIWGNFDRRGYNWIDLYPVTGEGEDAEPFEIPLPGRISYFDMWVWGSNLRYYIEAYVRDYQGIIHSIRLGDIAYAGWKNLRLKIPNTILQSKRILPKRAGLTFVKFRIWTTPTENVSNFYIYFDQFKMLTDAFETFFDGDELADPERIQQFWSNSN
ncbi:MAG: flagellar filament outer layer protein FlaA [Treponema sp.]|nr:flagellar filament outer layer protein FlaA [Treponema sp.]